MQLLRWANNKIKDVAAIALTAVLAAAAVKERNFIMLNKKYGSVEQGRGISIGEVGSAWLEVVKTENKYSTYVKYNSILNCHIIPSFGTWSISDITTEAMQRFIYMKLDGKNGRSFSGKTVKCIVSVMHLIVMYAAEQGYICQCDFKRLKIRTLPSNLQIMNKHEYSVLVRYLFDNMDFFNLGLLICLFTGIRLGEVCALSFNDIKDDTLYITKTMQRIQCQNGAKKTKVLISPPKSNNSYRMIPMPSFLMTLIKKFYRANAFVLTGMVDKFVEPRTFQNRFKRILSECGISDMNVHICRHTFATRCVEMGCEIKALSEILGHSSVNVTLNRYVHPSMEMKKKVLEALSRSI